MGTSSGRDTTEHPSMYGSVYMDTSYEKVRRDAISWSHDYEEEQSKYVDDKYSWLNYILRTDDMDEGFYDDEDDHDDKYERVNDDNDDEEEDDNYDAYGGESLDNTEIMLKLCKEYERSLKNLAKAVEEISCPINETLFASLSKTSIVSLRALHVALLTQSCPRDEENNIKLVNRAKRPLRRFILFMNYKHGCLQKEAGADLVERAKRSLRKLAAALEQQDCE